MGAIRADRHETLTKDDGSPRLVWRRVPMEGSITLPLAEGAIGTRVPVDDAPDVVVTGLVRGRVAGSVVTVFLVNRQEEPDQLKAAAWLFQPELVVEGPHGEAVFRRREAGGMSRDSLDPAVLAELDAMAMLYRHRLEFAVGIPAHASLQRWAREAHVLQQWRRAGEEQVPGGQV